VSNEKQMIGRIIFGLLTAISGAAGFAATPQPSEALRYFDGSWHCNGVFPSNGQKISSKLTFSWYAQTGSILKQHDDEPPNAYHAVELWAASSKGGFQNMVADSFGGVRFFSSSGWVGDAFTWVGDSAPNRKEQFVYTKLEAGTLRIDWSVSKNGAAFVIGDTLTCLRTKA
jgi:hypothetical protein